MKNHYLLFLTLLMLASCSGGSPSKENSQEKAEIKIKNTAGLPLEDALAAIDAETLAKHFPELELPSVKLMADTPVPFQLNDLDEDGAPDELLFIINLGAGEEKVVSIEPLKAGESLPAFKKRTQAELSYKTGGQWDGREYKGGTFENTTYLRVPPEHTDHSWFIRYEGPGWESDKVGYRFYLDWRNATDIFGKKTSEMVLQNVGQDGFDSYHEPSAWGMDILKVGESLGIGSVGFWTGEKALRVATTDSVVCSIPVNGPIQSMVRTVYYGWDTGEEKANLTSELSIHAGSRLTRHELSLSNPLPNLCTGIVKLEGTTLLKDDGQEEWGYLATWGAQSLAEDQLGMAVIFKNGQLIQQTEDEHSHVVVLRPANDASLVYYFLAAWEQEPGGIKTEEAFRTYLTQTVKTLSSPVEISYGE
ncbi:MAG: DUF4861 domain-containing protein [Lewinellaceae bacterium]|nr:DUF4861 domain-containing protein [Lewinellaceae bacterium]